MPVLRQRRRLLPPARPTDQHGGAAGGSPAPIPRAAGEGRWPAVTVLDALVQELVELTPQVPAPDWDLALCQETDPEVFFPELGESGEPAKQVCRRCDLREECLGWALATRQKYGIWGGLSARERQRLLRRRREVTAGA